MTSKVQQNRESAFEEWFSELHGGDKALDRRAFYAGWDSALGYALGTCETRCDGVEGALAGALLGEVTVLIGKNRYHAMKQTIMAVVETVGNHPDFNGPLGEALNRRGVDLAHVS